jgi:hypothetical protein
MLICVCCVQHVFLCLNTDFVGSTNTILDVCLILSTIFIFISVSGCVGICRGPSALLCPGAYNAVKMALPLSYFILFFI